MYITYSLLMQFLLRPGFGLTEEKIGQQLPGNGNGVDKGTISKYINGKIQVKKEVTKDVFYNAFFGDIIAVNEETVDDLISFLKYADAWEEDYGVNLPRNYKGNEDACAFFIKYIISLADESRAKKIKGEKINNKIIDCAKEPQNMKFERFVFDKDDMSKFVGREELINSIGKKLDSTSFVVICGMGGIGKTRSALKYAYENLIDENHGERRYNQFQQVFFTADLRTTMLNIKFSSHPLDNADEELERRLNWLEGFGQRTLLIIDNMDSKPTDKDNKILERLIKMGTHILITSRDRFCHDKYLIEISAMSTEEQLQLFELHYLKNPFSSNDLLKLFNKVDGHTMLIELIAKTMQINYMEPKEMLQSLENGDNEVVDEIYIEKDNELKQEHIYSYISKLFDINNLEPRLKNILIKLSLSSITGIRPKLLSALLGLPNVSDINSLRSQSWIIGDNTIAAVNTKVHLHPAVRTAVINSTHPTLDDLADYISTAITAFNSNQVGHVELNDGDKLDLYDILNNAWIMFSSDYSSKRVKLLCSQAIAISSINRSSYSESLKQMYDLAIKLLIETEDNYSKDVLPQIYKDNADLCTRLGLKDEAEEKYKKSIELFKKNKMYRDLASAYNGLANLYRKNSKYDDAKKMFNEADRIVQKNDVQDLWLEADICNNMGILYLNNGELDNAFEYYDKARIIREELPESEKQKKDLAYSFHNIATVFQRKKHFLEAAKWRRKALEIRKEVYSEDDPIIAESLTMMGNDIVEELMDSDGKKLNQDESLNKEKEAMLYFSQGLEIRKSTLGENHPAIAWSYQSIGTLFLYQGKYEQALSKYMDCLSIRENRLREGHNYTAKALYWIGRTYFAMKQIAKAMEFLEKAYSIQKIEKYIQDIEPTQKLISIINKNKSITKGKQKR